MNKYFYPIFKLPTFYERDYVKEELPLWIKWWLLGKAGRELSEILTGSEFTLLHTLNKKFKVFEIKGQTEQEQLSGKNLAREAFDEKLGISGTGQNRTVISTEKYRGEIIEVKSNTTYTASGDFSVMENSYIRIGMFDNYPNIDSVTTKYEYGASPFTFTTDTNTKYLLLFNSGNVDTVVPNLQLEQGSTATSYEPYCRTEYQAQTQNFQNKLKM